MQRREQLNRVRTRKPSVERRTGPFDYSLFVSIALLIIFGCMMVYSASSPYAVRTTGDEFYYLKRNIVFSIIGISMMFVISFIDYRRYEKYVKLIFIGSFLLCFAVFVPGLSNPINNAHRWINLGLFTLMPSDILKVGSVMYLASFLSERPLEKNGAIGVLLRVIAIVAITIFPVALQPNFSAVMVLAMTLLILYFIGGMNLKHLLIIALLGIAGLVFAFWPSETNYRLDRLLIVLDPTKDPLGDGWQLLQSLYAVSSGGLLGVGFGQSRQKFDYLADEPHNDFIYAVIGEEFGFLGATILILVFVFIVYRCFQAASQCRTQFGRLLGYGLATIIGVQSLVNIGVAIGMVPPTGITLPFVSYGGSSLIIMCSIIGVLLNISRDSS